MTVGLWRLARFGITGGINTGVDLAVFSALVFGLGVPAVPANLAAFGVALCGSYLLNRYWVFATRGTGVGRFVASNLFTALLATAVLWGMMRLGLPVLAAKVLATGLSMVVNYLLMSRLVFRGSPA